MRTEQLIEALKAFVEVLERGSANNEQAQVPQVQITPAPAPVAQPTPPQASPEPQAAPAPAMDLNQVQTYLGTVAVKLDADGRNKLSQIVYSHGVANIRDLDPAKYPELVEQVKGAFPNV